MSIAVPGAPEFDQVEPEPSSMIESMRAHGYTLPAAIADLIDNSIAAGAGSVWLRFEWDGDGSWISIADDGRGMTEIALRDAMRLGSRSPLDERESTDLGRFGLGLKTASLSQCRRLTVASWTADSDLSVRRWDLDHLARPEVTGWQLLKNAAPGSEKHLGHPSRPAYGTVVLWEALDRLVGQARVDDEGMQAHFLRSVETVETHLAMVFHRYLSARRLSIFVNEHPITAWDPFLDGHP